MGLGIRIHMIRYDPVFPLSSSVSDKFDTLFAYSLDISIKVGSKHVETQTLYYYPTKFSRFF